MKEYTTIQGDNTVEIVIEKSRFIATAIHVDTVEQAQDFIAAKRKKHFDATHNCYGYIIGDKAKFSDDGEPQGTAGMPIYECIKNSKNPEVVAIRELIDNGYTYRALKAFRVNPPGRYEMIKKFEANGAFSF